MSGMFHDGSHVEEIFASKLKFLVNGLAIDNEHVNFHLNKQDAVSVNLSCDHAYAYEHITFMNALDSEIQKHGIAIVTAADYRSDTDEHTIFIVCDDDD